MRLEMTIGFPEVWIKTAREIIEMCRENAEHYFKEAEKETTPDPLLTSINKRMDMTNGYIDLRIETKFIILESLMKAVNSLSAAIDTLPDKEEFNVVKSVIQERFQEIDKTLGPLKEAIDEANERRKRGDDVYR
jgi:hypothetical protein